MGPDAEHLTIVEAARATGLSEKAIRRRIERGTLPSLVRGTRRVIPRSALEQAGYRPPPPPPAPPDAEALALLQATVDSLARRMDALELWVLRSLQDLQK